MLEAQEFEQMAARYTPPIEHGCGEGPLQASSVIMSGHGISVYMEGMRRTEVSTVVKRIGGCPASLRDKRGLA